MCGLRTRFDHGGDCARAVGSVNAATHVGKNERDWLFTVPRSDGSLLFLIFISPERDFNQLQPTFDKMLSSFQLK